MVSPASSAHSAPPRQVRQVRSFVGRAATRYWPSADVGRPPNASVVIIPGRGEHAGMHEGLAARLAVDGYDVTYLGPGEDSVLALGEARRPHVPFVLLGSDAGGLRALSAAGSPALRPDGLVLVGLPLLHRNFAGEQLAELPPRALPDLPILLIHGEDDEVSPPHLVKMITRTAPWATLRTVPGGHRLVDGPTARQVAALTVLFVEALARRPAGPAAVPLG